MKVNLEELLEEWRSNGENELVSLHQITPLADYYDRIFLMNVLIVSIWFRT